MFCHQQTDNDIGNTYISGEIITNFKAFEVATENVYFVKISNNTDQPGRRGQRRAALIS